MLSLGLPSQPGPVRTLRPARKANRRPGDSPVSPMVCDDSGRAMAGAFDALLDGRKHKGSYSHSIMTRVDYALARGIS